MIQLIEYHNYFTNRYGGRWHYTDENVQAHVKTWKYPLDEGIHDDGSLKTNNIYISNNI